LALGPHFIVDHRFIAATSFVLLGQILRLTSQSHHTNRIMLFTCPQHPVSKPRYIKWY